MHIPGPVTGLQVSEGGRIDCMLVTPQICHYHNVPGVCELRCDACGYTVLSDDQCLGGDPVMHLCHHDGHLAQRTRVDEGQELIVII
jgi:hypothetical protein